MPQLSPVDIPTEIWIQIAQYIPKDLYGLIGLNRFFLEVGMDSKWGKVRIDLAKPAEAIHTFERLQNPFVATRVKHLDLTHHFMSSKSETGSMGLGTRLLRAILSVGHASQQKAPATSDQVDVFATLMSILPRLNNVRSLDLDFFITSAQTIEALLECISTSFGNSVEKLKYAGHMFACYSLLNGTRPRFGSLKELHVVLSHSDVNALTSFGGLNIGHNFSTVELLRIHGWTNDDLSDLFTVFAEKDCFPNLKGLIIRTAFDRSIQQPSALQAFLLRRQNTLEMIELRLNPSRALLNPSTEQPLGEWLAQFVEGNSNIRITFPKLRTLDFYPTNTEVGVNALLSWIHRTSRTLVSLTVRDRYFPAEQAREVIEAAASCNLTYLRMNVMLLDIELLDFLAEKLPDLEKIWLAISDVGDTETNTFHEAVQSRRYTNWKLRDIAISQGGMEMDSVTMQALASVIPSVTSFFGHGTLTLGTF